MQTTGECSRNHVVRYSAISHRAFGNVVQLKGEEGAPPYLVKLIPAGDGAEPDFYVADCGDHECREWLIADVLDDEARPTGQRIHHVAECHMSDPTS